MLASAAKSRINNVSTHSAEEKQRDEERLGRVVLALAARRRFLNVRRAATTIQV
jgi:hypothetical protein